MNSGICVIFVFIDKKKKTAIKMHRCERLKTSSENGKKRHDFWHRPRCSIMCGRKL